MGWGSDEPSRVSQLHGLGSRLGLAVKYRGLRLLALFCDFVSRTQVARRTNSLAAHSNSKRVLPCKDVLAFEGFAGT